MHILRLELDSSGCLGTCDPCALPASPQHTWLCVLLFTIALMEEVIAVQCCCFFFFLSLLSAAHGNKQYFLRFRVVEFGARLDL